MKKIFIGLLPSLGLLSIVMASFYFPEISSYLEAISGSVLTLLCAALCLICTYFGARLLFVVLHPAFWTITISRENKWMAISIALCGYGIASFLLFCALLSFVSWIIFSGAALEPIDRGEFRLYSIAFLEIVTRWTPIPAKIFSFGLPVLIVGITMRAVAVKSGVTKFATVVGTMIVVGVAQAAFLIR